MLGCLIRGVHSPGKGYELGLETDHILIFLACTIFIGTSIVVLDSLIDDSCKLTLVDFKVLLSVNVVELSSLDSSRNISSHILLLQQLPPVSEVLNHLQSILLLLIIVNSILTHSV